ncbi:hypothetical protein LTR05_005944 [Lithohypha guttulata]|uniref:Mitochondrial thiamine pyrophosphate carrier 1 n=1 Tax=Lithohypha guttulata TaxID=1690604 RepID=A0AAN7SXH2_9EURO|nr:hypothetical protein LTR05_005944 [Lithohypha guttulata]
MSISTKDHVDKPGARLIDNPWFQKCRPFVVGGCSGMISTCIIQPLDLLKVRLQLFGEGSSGGPKPTPVALARTIVAQDGVVGLYNGLSAGLLRQLVYGTARLGLFFTFEDTLKQRAEASGTSYGFGQRAFAGLAAGGLAAFIGNPVEVVLIRMQSDTLKPPAQQMRYRSAFHALSHVARVEGIRGLWTGSYPTIVRAMATNFGQLAFFSETKNQLSRHTSLSEQSNSVIASGVAGFFASFFSLPFDFVKTRLQRQTKTDAVQYRGLVDCFVRVARQEGLLRFYRGFGTYLLRIAPHTMITLIIADRINSLLRQREDGN